MNNRGTSLLEIIVYITLFAIVSILIGTQLNSICRSFSRGVQLTMLQGNTRDALSIIIREIRNTGFKSYLVSQNGIPALYTNKDAFLDDSSSFNHLEGDPGDQLTVLKAVIDKSGSFTKVDTIDYYLENNELTRRSENKVTKLATNIYAIQFQYGILGSNTVLLSEMSVNPANWKVTNCTKIQTSPGLTINVSGATDASVKCLTNLSINSNCRVALRFRIQTIGAVSPADTLKWVLRSSSQSLLASEPFIPSNVDNEVIMPVPSFDNGNLFLEFQSKCSGSLYMERIEFVKIENGEYAWIDNPSLSQKKFVRAIRMAILSRSKNKSNTIESNAITVGNITVQRSGPYTWRMYSEIAEIANNGLF